jgi:hypothetical protein
VLRGSLQRGLYVVRLMDSPLARKLPFSLTT